MLNLPWYKEGLRFKCTGCGQCCTGAPGYVWVTEDEIIKIAESLQMQPEIFARKYVRLVGERLSLIEIEKEGRHDCAFLENNRCTIYENRPRQCRTFPWWGQNLDSEKAWLAAAKDCEGINHPDGSLIPCEEIEKHL